MTTPMTVEIAPEVRSSATFGPLVERATEWLRESLPNTDVPVQAEWTSVDNRPGEEMVALTLKDGYSSPTQLFRKAALQDRDTAEHEINKQIRTLLRYRTNKMLERLRGMFGEGSE